MLVVLTDYEFDRLHGGLEVARQIKAGHWLFPDGAQRKHIHEGRNEHIDPPADEEQRLILLRRYHELLVVPAEQDFRKLKLAMEGVGRNFHWDERCSKLYGPASGDGIRDLQRLRDIVIRERDAIKRIDAEIDNLPANRKRFEEAEKARQRKAEFDRLFQQQQIEAQQAAKKIVIDDEDAAVFPHKE